MQNFTALLVPLLALNAASSAAPAAGPTPGAIDEASRWTAAKFAGIPEGPPASPPGLVVLANNDPVQTNARGGRPLRIADTEFTRGLYCHAFSKILRSTLVTHFTACFDVRRKDLDYDLIRRVLGQWRQYAPYYFGDYYPLTAYSLDQTAWQCPINLPCGRGLLHH